MHHRFQSHDRIFDIQIERRQDKYIAIVDVQTYELEALDAQPGQLSLRFGGRSLTFYWAAEGSRKWISLNGCIYCLDKPAAHSIQGSVETESGQLIRSPMPANVRAIQVGEGDQIEKGRTILLLEAMKMEIRIKAPLAGHVKHLLVSGGQAVEKDQILAEIGD